MTRPLPQRDVEARVTPGASRLSSIYRRAFKAIKDPAVREVVGELFRKSRENQENFEEIEQWFPVEGHAPDDFRALEQAFAGEVPAGVEEDWETIEEFDADLFGVEGNLLRVDLWAEHTHGTEGEPGPEGPPGEGGEGGTEGRWASVHFGFSSNHEQTDPGKGKLKLNGTLVTSSKIFISRYDADENSLIFYEEEWGASTTEPRGYLYIRKIGEPETFAIYKVTSEFVAQQVEKSTTWGILDIQLLDSGAKNFNDGDAVTVEFYRTGDKGEKGPEGKAGPEGKEGPAGEAGPQGEKGATGEKGEAGPAGEDGKEGPEGKEGKEGPAGEKGDPGPSELTENSHIVWKDGGGVVQEAIYGEEGSEGTSDLLLDANSERERKNGLINLFARNQQGRLSQFVVRAISEGAVDIEAKCKEVARTILNAAGESHFMTRFSGGVASLGKNRINWGVGTIEFPGSQYSVTLPAVAHGLGTTPKVVFAFQISEPGFNIFTTYATWAYTETTFAVKGRETAGVAIGPGSVGFAWVAMA